MSCTLFAAEEQDKLHEAATSAQAVAAKKARKRKPGNCRTRGKPMLGHKSRQCKPKEWQLPVAVFAVHFLERS